MPRKVEQVCAHARAGEHVLNAPKIAQASMTAQKFFKVDLVDLL
jgi:hypothetical protein